MSTHAPSSPGGPESALGRLGRILLTEHSMHSVLAEIVGLARASLPGQPEASVTLLTGRRPSTAAASGDLARDLDQRQYDAGAGPCLHAAVEEVVVEVRDTRVDGRWPEVLPAVAARGCLSCLSLPLPLHEGVAGSLNLYAGAAGSFDAEARDFAVRFASYAAVVAGNFQAYESVLDRARNLEASRESRAAIDQAKGILMERFGLTADQAFQRLARISMASQRKVRDIAVRFVDTGELSDGDPR